MLQGEGSSDADCVGSQGVAKVASQGYCYFATYLCSQCNNDYSACTRLGNLPGGALLLTAIECLQTKHSLRPGNCP